MRLEELYCATRLREGKVVRSTKGGGRDLRFETADYQTSDNQTSDWHCAWNLIPVLTVGHMVRGDFSTSLRSARNDIGEFG